ncbi:unnamed protein product [Strongylus vulgaris]|uniref:Prolyl 4-hydroxylase alpha subunit domain-containing protein n=1 Tax=Strongylus vulgaris TaxID=40348 RepID=A0A3P7J777_STRVU|nr:unnamed protein product [Strongylus vulgaris]
MNKPANYSCYMYRVEFEYVKVEVLSTHPILLVYHQFATTQEIKAFLTDADSKEMKMLKVTDSEGNLILNKGRQANGTSMKHEETKAVGAVFRKIEKSIPAVDFRRSEAWQVLSYLPGGHYAPHYDFFNYTSKEHRDQFTRDFGDRFATLLLVLQTAKGGGETVYPYLFRTITPKPGDVLFWTNLDKLGNGVSL